MPPSASSKRPIRLVMAPVNAPFSWPKSSLSTKPAGRALQLILINGLSARLLAEWIAPRDQLFPCAGLTGDEHRGIGRCHAPDVVKHCAERGSCR